MSANTDWHWTFRAVPLRIVDGDTLRCLIDLGFWLRNTVQLRLIGIDTPEPRGASRDAGLAATQFTSEWLQVAMQTAPDFDWPLVISTAKADSFNRWLVRAVRTSDLRCLNDDLVSAGHAVPWTGRNA